MSVNVDLCRPGCSFPCICCLFSFFILTLAVFLALQGFCWLCWFSWVSPALIVCFCPSPTFISFGCSSPFIHYFKLVQDLSVWILVSPRSFFSPPPPHHCFFITIKNKPFHFVSGKLDKCIVDFDTTINMTFIYIYIYIVKLFPDLVSNGLFVCMYMMHSHMQQHREIPAYRNMWPQLDGSLRYIKPPH